MIVEKEPKLWRVYYNCREHFPHLCAVDNGTIRTQIRVQWFRTEGQVDMTSGTDMGRNGADMAAAYEGPTYVRDRKGRPNEPIWWMECHAIAHFQGGGVVLSAPGTDQ